MGKVITKLLRYLPAFIILCGVFAYLFRLTLIDVVLRHQLNQLGIKDHSFSVDELSLNNLVLKDLYLGSGQAVSARKIETSWTMESIASGSIVSISIVGLRVSLDLRSERSLLDSLSKGTGVKEKQSSGIQLLPNIDLVDAKLFIHSATGGATVTINGSNQTILSDQPALVIKLDAVAEPDLPLVDQVFLSPDLPNHSAASSDERLQVSFFAKIDNYQKRPSYTLELKTTGYQIGSDANRVPPLQSNPETASFSIRADGTLPPIQQLNDDWLTWLDSATMGGYGAIRLNKLAIPDKIGSLTGRLSWDMAYEDSKGTVTVDEASQLTAADFSQHWLKQLGLSDYDGFRANHTLRIATLGKNTAGITVKGVSGRPEVSSAAHLEIQSQDALIQIRATSKATLNEKFSLSDFHIDDLAVDTSNLKYANHVLNHLKLSGSFLGKPNSLSGTLDVYLTAKRLQISDMDAQQLRVKLPIHLKYEAPEVELSLDRPGEVSVGKLKLSSSARIVNPLSVRIPSATLHVTPARERYSLKHRVNLVPRPFTLKLDRDNEAPLSMECNPRTISLKGDMEAGKPYRGENRISNATITFPQHQIQLNRIRIINRTISKNRLEAKFNISEIRHLAEKPLISPLSLTGNVALRDNRIRAAAEISRLGSKNIRLSASHSLASGKGKLEFEGDSISFIPQGLQPSSYLPDLAAIQEVSGVADLRGQLDWSADSLSSRGQLDLTHWSFKVNETQISDLEAHLELSDLITPQSPPQQRITIGHIDVGVPLQDLVIQYQIQAGESPLFAIEHAEVSTLGGQLSIGPTIIDPFASRMDMEVKVKDLNLKNLFKVIEVEGLTGDGQLNGQIPIAFQGKSVSVADGRLAAKAPGILRVKSQEVADVLGGRVENLDLLIEALTEFHYSELGLILNNSTNNDMAANLSLLGNNPNVLDGRMFRLNINLESNISKILDALAQAYGLSNAALQRVLRLQ